MKTHIVVEVFARRHVVPTKQSLMGLLRLRLAMTSVLICILSSVTTCEYTLAASEVFVYDSKNRRDPFLPLVNRDGTILSRESEGAKTINDVSLQGILWDPNGTSYAILNGNPVREGEEFEGLEVIKITKEWVAVRFGGEEYTLKITEEGGE